MATTLVATISFNLKDKWDNRDKIPIVRQGIQKARNPTMSFFNCTTSAPKATPKG
jgi:hypothetical protein